MKKCEYCSEDLSSVENFLYQGLNRGHKTIEGLLISQNKAVRKEWNYLETLEVIRPVEKGMISISFSDCFKYCFNTGLKLVAMQSSNLQMK